MTCCRCSQDNLPSPKKWVANDKSYRPVIKNNSTMGCCMGKERKVCHFPHSLLVLLSKFLLLSYRKCDR